MKRLVYFLLILAGVVACGDPVEKSRGFMAHELELLLSQNSSKGWLRTEMLVNGQPNSEACADSLIYFFVMYQRSGELHKDIYMAYNPNQCTEALFCNQYPSICQAHVDFCSDTTQNCDELPTNLLFSGTWYAVAPEEADQPTDRLVINFPGDTTEYTINQITSQYLEMAHTELPQGDEIIEKLMH